MPYRLYKILESGALYPTESQEAFADFRKEITGSLGGHEDFIDRMLISDIAEHAWEALHLRKLKSSFLLRHLVQRLYEIIRSVERADFTDEKIMDLLKIHGSGEFAWLIDIEARLFHAHYTIAAVEAEVVVQYMAALQDYDRMIAHAEGRRDYHLRELEGRHGVRRSRRRDEIVELSKEDFSTVGTEADPQ